MPGLGRYVTSGITVFLNTLLLPTVSEYLNSGNGSDRAVSSMENIILTVLFLPGSITVLTGHALIRQRQSFTVRGSIVRQRGSEKGFGTDRLTVRVKDVSHPFTTSETHKSFFSVFRPERLAEVTVSGLSIYPSISTGLIKALFRVILICRIYGKSPVNGESSVPVPAEAAGEEDISAIFS